MLHAFIIHSFSEINRVKNDLVKLKATCTKLKLKPVLLAKHDNEKWIDKACALIEKTHITIFFASERSLSSSNTKQELSLAIKMQKPVFVFKMEKDLLIPSEIIASENIEISDSLDKAKEFIYENYFLNKEFKIELFNGRTPSIEEPKLKEAFEQYKILVSSSDQLIERRHKTNTFFLTANGAASGALGYLAQLQQPKTIASIYLVLISIIGILLCSSWHSLLISYGNLNRGKFKVINEIEKLLPLKIFAAEWIALGKGLFPSIYKSFTESERNVPKIFSLIYCIFSLTISWWIFWNQMKSQGYDSQYIYQSLMGVFK